MFLTILFQFSSSIYFWVVFACVIWYRIWILSLKVSPDPDWEPDTSMLPDLIFLEVRFDRFQFQTLFSIIYIFHDFLKFFRIILQNLQNRCRSASLTDFRIFNFQTGLNFRKRLSLYFLEIYFLSKYIFLRFF